MSTPREGSIAWLRMWQGEQFRRGAQVTVRGERGRVLSTSGGRVAIRLWASGRRVVVLPHEVEFATGELSLV